MMVIAGGQVQQTIRNFSKGSPRHPSFSTPVLAAGWCKITAERQCSRCYVYPMHFSGQKDTLCFQPNKNSKHK